MVPGGSAAGTRAAPPSVEGADYGESNAAKARALVDAAINMRYSDRAVKLLWQATDLDPTLGDAYMYPGLYYNSRSQFDRVVQVFQKEVKYEPKELNAYLNIGEAYMSYTPPKFDSTLPYFRTRNESAVDLALLPRRQQHVTLEIGGVEAFAALGDKVAMGGVNLRAGLLHYLADLLALRRRQIEHTRHPIERPFAG